MQIQRCATCSREFSYYPSASAGRFCSQKCYWLNKKGIYPLHTGQEQKPFFCQGCGKQFTHRVRTTKLCRDCIHKQVAKPALCQHCGVKLANRYAKSCQPCFTKFEKLRADKHPNWKGGITKQNKIQRTIFRQMLQKKIFARDNYTCQKCGATSDLQVDHEKSWAKYPELRFDMNNCTTLCKKCHYEKTYGYPMPDTKMAWGHNLGRSVV